MGKRTQSIVVDDMSCCFVCGLWGAEAHHIFFGDKHRSLSDKYGLLIPLCYKHHRGNASAHNSREMDLCLKKIGQAAFERTYRDLNFLEIFGRNYLDKEN